MNLALLCVLTCVIHNVHGNSLFNLVHTTLDASAYSIGEGVDMAYEIESEVDSDEYEDVDFYQQLRLSTCEKAKRKCNERLGEAELKLVEVRKSQQQHADEKEEMRDCTQPEEISGQAKNENGTSLTRMKEVKGRPQDESKCQEQLREVAKQLKITEYVLLIVITIALTTLATCLCYANGMFRRQRHTEEAEAGEPDGGEESGEADAQGHDNGNVCIQPHIVNMSPEQQLGVPIHVENPQAQGPGVLEMQELQGMRANEHAIMQEIEL